MTRQWPMVDSQFNHSISQSVSLSHSMSPSHSLALSHLVSLKKGKKGYHVVEDPSSTTFAGSSSELARIPPIPRTPPLFFAFSSKSLCPLSTNSFSSSPHPISSASLRHPSSQSPWKKTSLSPTESKLNPPPPPPNKDEKNPPPVTFSRLISRRGV